MTLMTPLLRINSSHELLTSTKCKHGHSRKKFGVFNAYGYLRCRKCMTAANRRSVMRKRSLGDSPRQRTKAASR